MLAVIAAVLLLATIVMLGVIKGVYQSPSEPVEDLGWSVLALSIATLYVDVILVTVRRYR